ISAIASSGSFHKETVTGEDGKPRVVKQGWIFKDGVLVRTRQASDGEQQVEIIPPGGTLVETDIEPLDIDSAVVSLNFLTSEQMQRQYARMPWLRHLGVQLARRFSYPCASVLLLLL